jgi:hypothetical protein
MYEENKKSAYILQYLNMRAENQNAYRCPHHNPPKNIGYLEETIDACETSGLRLGRLRFYAKQLSE